MRETDEKDLQDEVPLSKLIRIREVLKTGSDECRNKLRDLGSLGMQERLNQFENIFEDILETLGTYIFAAIQPVIKSNTERQNLKFYFWPGYDSILKQGISNRVTLTCDFNGYPQHCGAVFPPSAGKKRLASDTSFWYERILTAHDEDVLRNGDIFSPGSMHLWLTTSDLRLPDDTPLNILEFDLSQAAKGPRVRRKRPAGVLSIDLSGLNCENWGKHIAGILNNPSKVKSDWLWPYPSLPSTPSRTSDDLDPETEKLQDIRQKLYSFWIAANVDRRLRRELWKWLPTFKLELNQIGLSHLSKRIEDGLKQQTNLEPSEYRFWYVLILERTFGLAGLEGREGLGSVMFLSSSRVPIPCLMVIKHRLEWIYLLMRYFEGATRLEQSGRTSQAIVAGHEAGAQLASASKFLPYIKENEKLVEIVKGSLNYAQLFLSTKPRFSGLERWLLKENLKVEEWLQACVDYAWHIVVARESRAVIRKELIFGMDGIIDAANIKLKVDHVCEPSYLAYSPPTAVLEMYETLPWDLSRWMLAAVSNAIKWSGPMSGQESGAALLREWSKFWREQQKSPFKQISILIHSKDERTELAVYNGYYEHIEHNYFVHSAKADGTEQVLRSICSSFPRFEGEFRFDNKLSIKEFSQYLPNEERGFVTSMRLKCNLFQPIGM